VGLVVDALLGESQVVVKPLSAALRHLPGFGGSTILGNGRVALIVNVSTLVEHAVAGGAAAPTIGGVAEAGLPGRTVCCAR
jgi:two-component system chemotaxis sensor kinase CheA